MKKRILLMTATIVLTALSFGTQAQTDVSLAEKGIPVTVSVPSGCVIEEGVGHGMEMEGVKSYVYELNSGIFSLEVSMDDEPMWAEFSEYMDMAKEFTEDESFVRYISSDDNGFLYEFSIEDETYYGFFYMIVKGDRLISFATGMESDDASLENIKEIYAAAKTAK